MILNALKLVQQELALYIEANSNDNFNDVVLENIAMLDNEDCEISDSVVISVVNLEEERTLKNVKSYVKNPITNSVNYHNQPVHLNLYVLFSAYFCSGVMPYELSLKRLSQVIRFFQMKNVFTVQHAESTAVLDMVNDPAVSHLRLILDLYTMTFEQLNHLWGALGGKQIPSAMYRARLVEIKDEKLDKAGRLIENIESNEIIY